KLRQPASEPLNVSATPDDVAYVPKRILGYDYDTDDEEYKQMKKRDVVLDDDFFADPKLRLVVEWVGYPHPKDYTKEPIQNIYTKEGRAAITEFMKNYYYENNEPRSPKTPQQYKADWKAFQRDYKPKFISHVIDILPLAAQFTDETEQTVRVRVATLREDYYRRVRRGEQIEKRYPIDWDGGKMFVTVDSRSFMRKFPDQNIFKAAKN
ncbi:hypothetical protein PENTCL1PPCAC_300, partial [Pristionchus entomophagus]